MAEAKFENFTNPPDDRLTEILSAHKSVAIVGLTPKQESPANRIARFLKRHGFRIHPVNPRYASVLGEVAYPYVKDIPEPVGILDVFRRPEHLRGLIEDAQHVGAQVLWLQLGIINEEFASQAQEAGFEVVMDRCMKKEYERLVLKRGVK
ncbi:MAG: CoA-binding protein [Candidatus Coatesbacteria bacterium]|nr:MAG: CoA-binding protein [Candidatus Coatesbacteria bacterium]